MCDLARARLGRRVLPRARDVALAVDHSRSAAAPSCDRATRSGSLGCAVPRPRRAAHDAARVAVGLARPQHPHRCRRGRPRAAVGAPRACGRAAVARRRVRAARPHEVTRESVERDVDADYGAAVGQRPSRNASVVVEQARRLVGAGDEALGCARVVGERVAVPSRVRVVAAAHEQIGAAASARDVAPAARTRTTTPAPGGGSTRSAPASRSAGARAVEPRREAACRRRASSGTSAPTPRDSSTMPSRRSRMARRGRR